MAKTHYQKLQNAKTKLCEGKINTTDFNKVAATYKSDAIKKGNHTAATAEGVISRVKGGACSAAVSGTKRKPTRAKAKPRAKRK
jgi:hypothetical protein